jgi:hypothetical protein
MNFNRTRHHASSRSRAASVVAALALSVTLIGDARASTPEVTDTWRFNVLLDDKPIGHHDFIVRRTETGQRVDISADFDVRFLRIPVYSYRHINTETWADGCLRRLDSRTDDNGERLSVSARQSGEKVVIETGEQVQEVHSECVMSFAYWNRDLVSNNELLNAQTGEMVRVNIEPVIATPPAEKLDPAELDAYRITSADGSVQIEVAYARDTGRWLYLESKLESGRVLRYLPGDSASVLNDGGEARNSS